MNRTAMFHKAGGLILAGMFTMLTGITSACQPEGPTVPVTSLSPHAYGSGRPGNPIHVSTLVIGFCEDQRMVGPCAIWDDANDADGVMDVSWWVEPVGHTYPDGAIRLPECRDNEGTGWPCVWPGREGDPHPDREVSVATVFGPEDATGGTVIG